MQTRLGSITEAWANIVVGFSINYIANLLIFPLFGFHISLEANFLMGLIYTVISLVRSYVLRRWFNGLKFGNAPAIVVGPEIIVPNAYAHSCHFRIEPSIPTDATDPEHPEA